MGMCNCSCHTGPYASCDIPGGCGSVGCGRDTRKPTAGGCELCAVYRPDKDARIPNRPPVCDGDRNLIDRHLNDIANLVADLSTPESPTLVTKRYERFDRNGASLGEVWKDPLTAVGGVAPINSRTKAPTVSGSRERPIPIPVTQLDLQARLRPVRLSQPFRGDPGDQVGYLSAAVVLAEWIRDIRDTLFPDHHLPKPTVDELVMWLRNRVDTICDRHPAVPEFAEEIRNLRGALRSAAGQVEPQPEHCAGIPCKRCDLMMLYRQPDSDVQCLNVDCTAVYRAEEYQEWIKTLVAQVRVKRHAEPKS